VHYTPEELTKHYTKFSAKKLPGQTSAQGMDVDGFLAYLLSKENRILNAPDPSDSPVAAQKDTPRDMTHPLNEYFISSSHNTYLLGRQLVGESSIEGYIRVLQLGCRCVEIDCWDGPDGWPVVEHGRTLYVSSDCANNSGTSVKFQDVVSVISKFAFIVTPYPLILSMEIHCGSDQQKKMAMIFRETLGRELLLENLEGVEEGKLPSPEELKYKILLKVHPFSAN
jgi:phosphatidylinositol phospholipase C delta